MKLLLLGFNARDEAALALFMKRHFPGWSWQATPAQRDLRALAPADLVFIDLAAHGWAQYSESACEALRQLPPQQSALLLVSGTDASWAAAQASCAHPLWGWLSKPYRAETLREALQQVQQRGVSLPGHSLVMPTAPAESARALPNETAALTPAPAPQQTHQQPTHQESTPPVAAEPTTHRDFGPQQLARGLAHAPPHRHVLLRAPAKGLQEERPFEMRFTMQHVLLVHPHDAWVASNTPMSVLQRVAASDVLATAVAQLRLDETQLDVRLHQIGAEPQHLWDFLQNIVPAAWLEPTLSTDHTP